MPTIGRNVQLRRFDEAKRELSLPKMFAPQNHWAGPA